MANSAYTFAGISGYSGFSGYSATIVQFTYANTFTPGQAIYRTSGNFALAQANAVSSCDILGVVQSATSSQFTIVANGYISGLTGLVDGSQYYLSDVTPGLITTTVPTAGGSVIKPVLIAIGSTAGIVVEYAGALIGGSNNGTSGYYAKWTSAQGIGNGLITDNGTTVTVTGNLSATGNTITAGLSSISPSTTILSGGNVGINTLNPNNALTVVGNISATGNITVGSGIFNKGIVASLIFGG